MQPGMLPEEGANALPLGETEERGPAWRGSGACSESGCLNSCTAAEGRPDLSQAGHREQEALCLVTRQITPSLFPEILETRPLSPHLGLKHYTSYIAFC